MKVRLTAVALLFLSAGCTTSTTGTPAASSATGPTSTSPSAAVTWDACTAVTPEVATAVGLDPATQRPYGGDSGTGAEESGCRWFAQGGGSAQFGADIGTANQALERYLDNPAFTSTAGTLGGRDTANFEIAPGSPDCNIAIDLGQSSAVVAVTAAGIQFTREQSCAAATRIGEAIIPLLP